MLTDIQAALGAALIVVGAGLLAVWAGVLAVGVLLLLAAAMRARGES